MRRTARWAFLAVLACGAAYGAAPPFEAWRVSRLTRNGTVYETGNGFDEPFDFHVKIAFARFNLEWLTDGRDRLP